MKQINAIELSPAHIGKVLRFTGTVGGLTYRSRGVLYSYTVSTTEIFLNTDAYDPNEGYYLRHYDRIEIE